MDVQGKTVLILGGAGEVGLEVCRLILMEAPKRLIVASSRMETGETASAKLRAQFPEMASEIHAAFGNIFVRADLKDTRKDEILANPTYQELIIGDILSELSEEIVSSSFLFQFREILQQDKEASGTTSSLFDRGQGFWKRTDSGELVIDPGEVAGWILTFEEKGERIKD